jgi:penicillin-binding protein 2
MIFDQNSQPLVRNIPIFKECPSGWDETQEKSQCKTITREEALKLEVQGKDAQLLVEIGREYLQKEAMAHLLGYLGEVTADEIAKPKCPEKTYQLGDLVGRTGIEEQYECFLRGVDGAELIEVDTHGLTLRKIGRREPVAGQDIFLSVDASLQQAAYEALKTAKGVYSESREAGRGAVVASDPKTGQILALVSGPSYEPNLMARADAEEAGKVEEIFQDPGKPFFNRATSGSYPPGSTFKIVTSAAALEEGKITAETKIEDPGQIVIGQYRFANWYFTSSGKTEGSINLVRAIARSTDTFFYKVGELVGATKLVSWGKAFGLGRPSGIDLPGEISGFLPDPAAGDWFLGNTYHLSIGQGSLGVTPLQLNMVASVVASGGELCQPQVRVKEQESGRAKECQEIKLKAETIKLITEGMKGACSPGGTAGVLFNFNPPVACKTGTAEFNDPKGRTHAWLTAFAPADNPEIVVTALVEAGGEGSSVAAPIVKRVLEEYFR